MSHVRQTSSPVVQPERYSYRPGSVAFFPLLILLTLALITVFSSSAQAKAVVNGYGLVKPADVFGREASLGGRFFSSEFPVGGVAVNQTGAGGVPAGTIYVADLSKRVQRFSPTGVFERTWGQNVIGRDEKQTITVGWGAGGPELGGKAGGSFTLTFAGQTATVNVSSSNLGSTIFPLPNELQSALEALPAIGSGNVSVEGSLETSKKGGSFILRFTGALSGADVPQLTINGSGLVGPGPISTSATTVEDGSGGSFTGFEICTIAAGCQDGIATPAASGGELRRPTGVAVNQANGHVYVAESIGNQRISEFDADGSFVRAWGWDVIRAGKPNDNGSGFEICDVTKGNAAADCKAGTAGSSGGQLGQNVGNPLVDSANHVWVPDASNQRIQEFDPAGSFIAAYGFNVNGGGSLEKCVSVVADACRAGTPGTGLGQFMSSQSQPGPGSLAFDAAGNLYATDGGNKRVQKFNPGLTSASNFGAAALAPYTTKAPEQVAAVQGGSRLVFAVNNTVAAEMQLIEVDPVDASVKGTSLEGLGLKGTSVTLRTGGLVENSATSLLYATTNAPQSPRRILALRATNPFADPVIAMSPVTVKTATTASFTGSVDPSGSWVSCRFQYSTDQIDWTDVGEAGCEELGAGSSAQAVGEDVAGLVPNTHYFVRLVVSRPLAADSTKITGVREFDTDPAPPAVANVGAIDVADTSARIVGTIDPRNSATSYVVHYGTTPALGLSTDPVDVGSGTKPLISSQVIGGLGAGTTYYFSLVATNVAGSSASAVQSFVTRADPLPLPDDRSYEQVSPVDKNYGGVDSSVFPSAAVSPDGQAAAFCTSAIFGDPAEPIGSGCGNYVSRRGEDGWRTQALHPPFCYGQGFGFAAPLRNLDRAVILQPEEASCLGSLVPGAPMPAKNLYLEDLTAAPPTFQLLAPAPAFGGATGNNVATASYAAASDDSSHIAYESTGKQTADALAANIVKVYEWSAGAVRLVSKTPAGSSLLTSSQVPSDRVNGVSVDGSRIFFMSPATGDSEIYMRKNGTATRWVSQQECSPACSDAGPDSFEWAASDGSRAFFLTTAKLVNEDTSPTSSTDLYMYTDTDNPAVDKNLTLVSVDQEPADGAAAGFLGVLGASDDGRVAYFAASGQLVPGAPTAGGPKVYRWRWNGGSPSIDYLATLPPTSASFSESSNWVGGLTGSPIVTEGSPMNRLVTPDGKYLLLQTKVQLDPVADSDADRDIYRWDELGGWTCASCQSPDVPSAGTSAINGVDRTDFEDCANPPCVIGVSGPGLENDELRIMMSDDGKHIFFTSRDHLVPADVNSVKDVYEWHDGTVNLISSGVGTDETRLISASESGEDVFFITRERLVGWDFDNDTDIYDARVGGGFPEPPAEGAPCEGEACRGAASSPVAPVGAGTAAFQGPGNLPSAPRKGKKKPHSKKKPHKRKGKKHSRGSHRIPKDGRRTSR